MASRQALAERSQSARERLSAGLQRVSAELGIPMPETSLGPVEPVAFFVFLVEALVRIAELRVGRAAPSTAVS